MDGLLWFLVIGGLFYFMMRFGCGAHMVHGEGGHGGHAGYGDAGEQTDPVCGMTLAADQGYSKMHQGTPYRLATSTDEYAMAGINFNRPVRGTAQSALNRTFVFMKRASLARSRQMVG